MAITVEEVLKQTGLTDEQIKSLDPKVIPAFTLIVTSAEQTLSKAELVQRAQQEQYDQKIAPALDNWANEKATLEAREVYYKTLAEKAQEGGFIPGDAPFTPPTVGRDEGGKFVAGKNDVPGSPKFVENLRHEAAQAIGSIADLQWKYRTLYGSEMPDAPTALIREAAAQHQDPITYAAKKYDFAGKEAARRAEEDKKKVDAAVAEAVAVNDKKWAEKVGNNPDLRRAEVSRFSEINKAVKDGKRPDPLMMTEKERDANTRRNIQTAIQDTGKA